MVGSAVSRRHPSPDPATSHWGARAAAAAGRRCQQRTSSRDPVRRDWSHFGIECSNYRRESVAGSAVFVCQLSPVAGGCGYRRYVWTAFFSSHKTEKIFEKTRKISTRKTKGVENIKIPRWTTVLSRYIETFFGPTRKSSSKGNFSDRGLNQSIKRRLSL